MGDSVSVLEAVRRVRELRTGGPTHPTELLAGLMVIEDAVQAIGAYEALSRFTTAGDAYLSKFGLLQALQLGFDAAEEVGRTLGVRLRADREPGGKTVLVTRNLVAGHPIGGTLNGHRWNHFHDRQTAQSKEVIRVMSFHAADNDIWTAQTVVVAQLISDGLGVIAGLLNRAVDSGPKEGP